MGRIGTLGFKGNKLKLACDTRGINQNKLAGMLGVSRQVVSSYVKGEKTPKPEIFAKISKILNYPQEFFLKDKTS